MNCKQQAWNRPKLIWRQKQRIVFRGELRNYLETPSDQKCRIAAASSEIFVEWYGDKNDNLLLL